MATTISRSTQRERRVSPALYKLLLTTHIMVAAGWLGVVFAKLVLGLAALTSNAPDVSAALYVSMTRPTQRLTLVGRLPETGAV